MGMGVSGWRWLGRLSRLGLGAWVVTCGAGQDCAGFFPPRCAGKIYRMHEVFWFLGDGGLWEFFDGVAFSVCLDVVEE